MIETVRVGVVKTALGHAVRARFMVVGWEGEL